MGQPQSRDSQEPTPGAEEGVVDQGQPPAEKVYFVGGRERTADEVARGYADATAENERLRARLEAMETVREPAKPKEPKVPTWVSGLVEAGVPEPVAKEMLGWVESEVEVRSKAATAEQVAGLVESLSGMAQADAASDAALLDDPQMEGYTPEGLKALLGKNPEFKKRYDRIFPVDPEGAKRLAWVTLKGQAKPRTTGRLTTPPTSRRGAGGGAPEDEKILAALKQAAREGAPGDVAKFMRARLAKYAQEE